MRAKFVFASLLLVAMAVPGFAQLSPSATWATQAAAQYTVNANLTYRTASNQQLKMDVYYRRNVTTPQPTLVYMHGGFWVAGAKETAITALMPWLEMGWNVVNVEYRLGVATDNTTLAPAAVDDCFCALRFVAGASCELQHRQEPHRRDRRIRWRTSGACDGNHPRERGPWPRMCRSCSSTGSGGRPRRTRSRATTPAAVPAFLPCPRLLRSSIGSASPTFRTSLTVQTVRRPPSAGLATWRTRLTSQRRFPL